MTIAQTRFWIDREPRSIGVRSSNRTTGSQPFECYLNRHWNVFGLHIYEDGNESDRKEFRLSFKLLWFTLNMLLFASGKWGSSDNGRAWGLYFMDRRSLVLRWGTFYYNFDLPFISRVFVRSELLSIDRKRVVYPYPQHGGFEGKEWEKRQALEEQHSANFPYRYELLNGEVQEVTATLHIQRYIRRWKWTPFKQVEDSIDVKFDAEVGPARGSWKGGCIGCGWIMRRGENPVQTLRRMERDRRFER